MMGQGYTQKDGLYVIYITKSRPEQSVAGFHLAINPQTIAGLALPDVFSQECCLRV